MDQPVTPVVGDIVVHHQMPQFRMPVLALDDCETDHNRPIPHSSVKIVDPEGSEDWLCAYELRVVTT